MYRSQIDKLNQDVATLTWRKVYVLFIVAFFAVPFALAQTGHSFAATGSLKIEIYAGGQLSDLPAQISVSSEVSALSLQQTVSSDGMATFASLLPGNYWITVHVAGFKDGNAQAQVLGDSLAEATIELEPADDADTQANARGFMLAPKAKKDLDLGLAAIQASQFEQAQKHLEAAYNLAPGDPNVSSALGELYILTNNFDKAQQYIEHATSVAPDNVSALVETGQLRILQSNFGAAQPSLERAIHVAPRDKFAHWLLGITYLDLGLFEKARIEATEVVKINKSAATDGEFLLGEALAGLGRTTEAIDALKTFVNKVPQDAYTPYAQNLIAKLQSEPAAQGAQQGATQTVASSNETSIR